MAGPPPLRRTRTGGRAGRTAATGALLVLTLLAAGIPATNPPTAGAAVTTVPARPARPALTGPTGPTGPTVTGPSPRPPVVRPKAPATIVLNWVGDIAFNTASGLPAGGLAQALAPVRSTLRSADVTLGNLEGTLSTGGTSKCSTLGSGNCFAFQAPPGYAGGLRASGFTVMNMANNHSYDFGARGQAQTLAALRRAGLAHDGLNGEITMLRVHGVRVAVIGFAPYPWANDLLDIPHAASLVRRARRRAQIVIVVIHAGAEGVAHDHVPYGSEYDFGEDRGNPRAFAHAVIDAGASIVVGSGPHVLRGIERYRGHMIAYSLGNFASFNDLGLGGLLSQSAILHVTLDVSTGRVTRGRLLAVRLVGAGLPRPDPAHSADGLVATLSREDFGSDHYRIAPDGAIRP